MASAPTCSPEISLGRYFWRLRFGTVAADLVNAQIGMGAVGQADRGRGAGNFLQRDDVGEVAHVGAAVFLAGGHAEQAHVAEFLPQVGWEFVDAVDFRGARRDLGVGKGLHRIAQHIDVFAEAKVEAGDVHGFVSAFKFVFQSCRA